MSLDVSPAASPAAHVTVLQVTGRLDNATTADFERRVEDLARTPGLVLDLAPLAYISSAGLRGLLTTLKRTSARGGRLALAAPARSVVEVLEISGFKSLLPVHPDVPSAAAALD